MITVYKIQILVFLYFLSDGISNAQKSPMAFGHLTTDDGLSQNYVYAILQDSQGFMWFATRDGLNRYDGNTFIVYKHNPDDTNSLSANFTVDIIEDDNGFLWIACNNGGVNKFNPTTGRFTRYMHDPDNPKSLSDNSVESMTKDSHGQLWFGTAFNGLNKFDPATETFSCYRNDSEGQFVGYVYDLFEDNRGDIWFVGDRGLFHVNTQTGLITHSLTAINRLAAHNISEDKAGNLWILAYSPLVGLVKYDRQTSRFTIYPLDDGVFLLHSCNLLDDGKNGFWVPTSKGLYHFDRQTGRFSHLYQHDEINPHSLNDNNVISVFQDRAGLLWLGTENDGLNILNFQQEQFGHYQHNPNDPNSLFRGRVNEIYEDPDGILWLGFFPRALDRFDRSTGKITHFVPGTENEKTLGKGYDVSSIHKDANGYIWIGGWESGLVRFDEQTGKFKHYRHIPDNPNSLISNNVIDIYEDSSGNLWVGQGVGLSCFNPQTEQFTNYTYNPTDSTSLGQISVRIIYQDRAGSLWLGTWQGVLSRFDYKTKTFHNFTPDLGNPLKLNGGSIYAIHEDRTGTLWLGSSDGLYRFNQENETFTRYTENKGLSSSSIEGILEDKAGRLWLSTKKGLSRFDPQTGIFRNYDAIDGVQDNNFTESCYWQGHSGEMFFGGSKGFYAFFPENIHDNAYIPPIVFTDFRLFGKSVPVGNGSVLKKTINQTDTLTLHYEQNNISFEFAALSYAAPEKNRYRYILEGFDTDWHNVGSKERLAVYTNLPSGSYVFRVQGTNHDGIWNREGKTIYLKILTPWWKTWWFKGMAVILLLGTVTIGFRLKLRNIKNRSREFERLVEERTAQLQAVNDELEITNESLHTVNKELESFSYSVSHDLRAPFRSINGFSQILLEEYQNKLLDKHGQDYLHRVRRGVQKMTQLIEDMLNLSRVSRDEMNIRQVNLSDMAKEIANDLRNSDPDRNVEFVIQDEIIANADERLIQSVLENLIGNAWKFTSKCPTAHIEFVTQQQDEKPVYFVRDNGAGFNMKYADKLFGTFQRLHDYKEFPGTGIGLATVQRIIHRHGGKVWAEGEVKKGATFYFTIP